MKIAHLLDGGMLNEGGGGGGARGEINLRLTSPAIVFDATNDAT